MKSFITVLLAAILIIAPSFHSAKAEYVKNDPINYSDPTGESAQFAASGVCGPAIAACAAAIAVGSCAVLEGCRNAVGSGIGAIGSTIGSIFTNDARDPVADLIDNTSPGEKTKGRTKNRESTGGIDQANEDFDSIVDPDTVEDRGEGVRTGETADGRKVNVRPGSSDGRATVEIQDGKNKTKIRYNDDVLEDG